MPTHVASELRYAVDQPTTFVLSVAARTDGQHIVEEQLRADGVRSDLRTDPAGNRLLVVEAEPGELTVTYDAQVDIEDRAPLPPGSTGTELATLPVDVLELLRPSRYCESDRLTRFAARTFRGSVPGSGTVVDICDWVHDHLEYVGGVTHSSTTALDVFVGGAGVCRDFAHLSIALCRALEVPARYVSGYAVGLDPPDFHGCFEAFLDGRWHPFDATRMSDARALVRIATGRDAADVAFSTYVGAATLTSMTVSAAPVPTLSSSQDGLIVTPGS